MNGHIKGQVTQRQAVILQRVVSGDSNKEIARALNISERTVEGHVRHMTKRLGMRNRVELAVWAVRRGVAA